MQPFSHLTAVTGLALCLGLAWPAAVEAQPAPAGQPSVQQNPSAVSPFNTKRNLRLGGTSPSDHPVRHGADAMNACLREHSAGQMSMRSFLDGALGSDMNLVQSLRTGTLDLTPVSISPVASIVPALGVFSLPFLFNSAAEATALLDGEVGDWFAAQLPATGLVLLAWWENGFRHITNSKRPIHQLEDLSGVKMRVMQSSVFLDTFHALGANAVPMAVTELYSALETGTVDGQENPLANIEGMKFYEVQKYLTLSGHTYDPIGLLLSKKTWDALNPSEQALLQQCALVGRDEQRRVNHVREAQGQTNLRAKGMQINEILPAEVERIRNASQVVYQRHAQTIGQEAIDRVQTELQRMRSNKP